MTKVVSKTKDAFFGGASKDAAKALTKQNRQARQLIEAAKQNAVPLLTQGFDEAVKQINLGSQQSRDELLAGIGKANAPFQGFFDRGELASEEQAALLGLRGQDAANAAFNRFQESPGQQFIREEGEKAIRRNAAATGQLQGGAVLRELTRFGTGLAQQDFGNQFARLQNLGAQGFNAAANISSNESALASNLANIAAGTSQNLGNIATARGGSLANLELGQASQIAPLLLNIGQAKAAGIIGQAQGFGQGARELASLVGGSGGFGVPSVPEFANNVQSLFSLIGGGAGGGAGGAGGALSSIGGLFGGGGGG